VRALSRLWTGAIAYVSLLVGAGLSIMYNILDTRQVRGAAFDWADLVTAVAAPGIVVLMVELFVSRLWIGTHWYVQVIRWTAVTAIGSVAMRASWTHGHDWMASRGQAGDVATLWPLATDLLAILATALILAGRRGSLASGQPEMAKPATGQFRPWPNATEMASMASHVNDPDNQMANGHLGQTEDPGLDFGRPILATQPDDPTVDIKAELARWNRGYDSAIDDLGQELAGEAEAYANAPAAASRQENIPADAADLIVKMQGLNARPGQIDEAVAEMSGKSTRVARRWRIALKNREG
jgi:hypothetical protein